MIPVTKPYLPPRERLDAYLDRVYASEQLTNNGPLVQELTEKLKNYLGVEHLLLVANGTMALQIAFEALNINGAAVTTPFTFPATSSSLTWQGIRPIYAAIDPATLNLDPLDVDKHLDEDVSAIVPVHTYGNPCEVEAFEALAEQREIKLIYDASHTFGVFYKQRSLLRWGDAATLSFHATKLFHTGEGGAIVFKHEADLLRARELINFGFVDGQPHSVGINGKMSELHAAMGLAVLEDIDRIIARRVAITEQYRSLLEGVVQFPECHPDATRNGAYLPVLLGNRQKRDYIKDTLRSEGIECRAYFSPSLDSLGLYTGIRSTLAGAQTDRILCLPVYDQLADSDIDRVVSRVRQLVNDDVS